MFTGVSTSVADGFLLQTYLCWIEPVSLPYIYAFDNYPAVTKKSETGLDDIEPWSIVYNTTTLLHTQVSSLSKYPV